MPLGRPSHAAPHSLSETSISPGPAIHETRTIPGATKITRSSRFRMIRPRLVALAISRRNPSVTALRVEGTANVEGSIMRTIYQTSQGLPKSDTMTKVVIVWSTSAGETCRWSLLGTFDPSIRESSTLTCVLRTFAFFPNSVLKHFEIFKSPNFGSSKWSLIRHILDLYSFLDFPIVQDFLNCIYTLL